MVEAPGVDGSRVFVRFVPQAPSLGRISALVGFFFLLLYINGMQEKSDALLLREYVAQKSEEAFGEVVRRHANLVYSAALRQVASADWAAEITQRVFIDLARKARSLAAKVRENNSVASWLYCATRFAALSFLREERNRQSREKQFMRELHPASESGPDWHIIAPVLDEAMAALSEREREALLWRFFKNQDFRTVGAALGVSDDTAQKRVARSLEKLRALLAQRGVTTTSAVLSIALATNAVQAAPAGLAATWIGASLAGATTPAGITLTFLKIMSMTKLQVGITAAIVGSLAITATVQHQSQNELRDHNEALRQQLAALAADNQVLSNRLEQSAPPTDQRELPRLRGEVAFLRQQTNTLARLMDENLRLKAAAAAQAPVHPDDEQLRFEGMSVRMVNTGKRIGLAMRIWANDHADVLPTDLLSVTNEMGDIPINLRDGFELVNVGKATLNNPESILARERAPRRNPQGGWERAYVLCDGSVQRVNSPEGNFDGWEQPNTNQVLELRRPINLRPPQP